MEAGRPGAVPGREWGGGSERGRMAGGEGAGLTQASRAGWRVGRDAALQLSHGPRGQCSDGDGDADAAPSGTLTLIRQPHSLGIFSL